MALIDYARESEIPGEDEVPDQDNIVQVHRVHSRVMRRHFDLYVELMRARGPLRREQREMIAVAVSAANDCHY